MARLLIGIRSFLRQDLQRHAIRRRARISTSTAKISEGSSPFPSRESDYTPAEGNRGWVLSGNVNYPRKILGWDVSELQLCPERADRDAGVHDVFLQLARQREAAHRQPDVYFMAGYSGAHSGIHSNRAPRAARRECGRRSCIPVIHAERVLSKVRRRGDSYRERPDRCRPPAAPGCSARTRLCRTTPRGWREPGRSAHAATDHQRRIIEVERTHHRSADQHSYDQRSFTIVLCSTG